MSVLSALASKVGRGARGVARMPQTIVRKQISGAVEAAKTLPGAFKDLALMTTFGPLPAMLGSLIADGAEASRGGDGEPAGNAPPSTSQDPPPGASEDEILGKIFQSITEHTGLLERSNILGEKSVNNSAKAVATLNAIAAILTKTAEITKETQRRRKAGASDEGLTKPAPAKRRLQPANLLGAPTGGAPAEDEKSFFGGIKSMISGIMGSIMGIFTVAGLKSLGIGKLVMRAFGVIFKRIFPIATLLYGLFKGIRAGWDEFMDGGDIMAAIGIGVKQMVASIINVLTFGLVGEDATKGAIDAAFKKLQSRFSGLLEWTQGWIEALAAIEIPKVTILGVTIGPLRPFAPLVGKSVLPPISEEEKADAQIRGADQRLAGLSQQRKAERKAKENLAKDPEELAASVAQMVKAEDSKGGLTQFEIQEKVFAAQREANRPHAAPDADRALATKRREEKVAAQLIVPQMLEQMTNPLNLPFIESNQLPPVLTATPSNSELLKQIEMMETQQGTKTPNITTINNNYPPAAPPPASTVAPPASSVPRSKPNLSGWDLDVGVGVGA